MLSGDIEKRVETSRFGPFTFQVGVDEHEAAMLLQRVADAQIRFLTSPLSQVANRLEQEVLISSIFSTNTIEGGTLTEEETKDALDLDPAQVHAEEQRRAVNIKTAYDIAQKSAQAPHWRLSVDFIKQIHAAVTDGIPHKYNQPGLIRSNPKNVMTHVGDTAHGGRYKPPQYGDDIALLLNHLVKWHDELAAAEIPALIRAPLMHYYFELIHPFWDGNGRVGRVLEATVLHGAGFRYAPFAMARYYMERIDQYFILFNLCRKQADKKMAYPNTPFALFHLDGMLTSINRLHDRVNAIVRLLLFETRIKHLRDKKEINLRQYAILAQVMERDKPLQIDKLRRSPWHEALYAKLGDKTKQRDLSRLREQELLYVDEKGLVWPGFMRSK
ncbi:MAG: Fic family protein [Syntrophus sp. (in: bacteria)]|nr:Fic family protein [Syntrophus sp. (in: bacteria)]